MYGTYNSERIEKLINTIQHMHNKTTWNEKLFVGKLNNWYQWNLSEEGVVHYTINSVFFITTLRECILRCTKKFINQLRMYANVIRVLSKGYLPTSLLPPNEIKKNFR